MSSLLERMRKIRKKEGRRMTWGELVDALEEARERRMLEAFERRSNSHAHH